VNDLGTLRKFDQKVLKTFGADSMGVKNRIVYLFTNT